MNPRLLLLGASAGLLLLLEGCPGTIVAPCSSGACSGCCDSKGVCHEASSSRCGSKGSGCTACEADQSCVGGSCRAGAGGGGESVGGGAGGGGATGEDAGVADAGKSDAGPRDGGVWDGGSFSFLVYGDSRAGGRCDGNAVHLRLVSQMAAEPADLVFHVGDMVTGYDNTTNWVSRGGCQADASNGSFTEMIAPLQNKTPVGNLPTFFFPVIGNHDDNWGSAWYPDKLGNGVCDAFSQSLIRQLVPNHTQQTYFQDKTGGNYPILSDADFYSRLCSTTRAASNYPTFFYYSFNHRNTHFSVLRVNSDYFNLFDCSTCISQSNYDNFYNIHQLHWLQYDLAKARATPGIDNLIILLHAPIFTSSDGHVGTSAGAAIAREATRFGARLVFSGHNHVYERSVPIAVNDAGPVADGASGTTYVVTGGGGSALHGFNAIPGFAAKRIAAFHYVRVKVSGTQIQAQAVDDTGAVIDSF